MRNINQDLQATYQILSLLQKSKGELDRILERLPGVFAVINAEGTIVNGSLGTAKLLNTSVEELLRNNFSKLFRERSWELFTTQLSKLPRQEGRAKPTREKVEFELSIWTPLTGERPFFWHISEFEYDNKTLGTLFTVIGNDISALRTAERQLADIFSNIPLGIFTINSDGKIMGKTSAHLEWLLGTDQIEGRTLKEVLFDPNWDGYDRVTRETIEQFGKSLGESRLIFDVVSEALPRQVFYPLPEAAVAARDKADKNKIARYIGLTCMPVTHDDIVERILVILEDQTRLVQKKKDDEKDRMLEMESAARVQQVKRCAPSLLVTVMDELEVLFAKIGGYINDQKLRELQAALHSAKGCSRIIGFDNLAKLVHNLESEVVQMVRDEKMNWEVIAQELTGVVGEWHEMDALYQAFVVKKADKKTGGKGTEAAAAVKDLFARYNAILSGGITKEMALTVERLRLALSASNSEPLSSIEEMLRYQTSETSKKLNKQAKVHFDWAGIVVGEDCRSDASEVLLHLVNNGISHGIETPDVRAQKGKNPEGTVTIRAREDAGRVLIEVEDDGGGVNVEKIKGVAIQKKLVTLDKILTMTKSEIAGLIFTAGFSTADQLTDISGRGVGLDAVTLIVEKHAGKIEVGDSPSGGAKFTFALASFKRILIQRIPISIADFTTQLVEQVHHLSIRDGFEVQLDLDESDRLKKGLIYVDASRMLLAITTLIGNRAMKSALGIRLAHSDGNFLTCTIRKLRDVANPKDLARFPEFTLPLKLCSDFVAQHGGEIRESLESGDEIQIRFGHLLGKENLAPILVELDEGVGSPADSQETLKNIQNFGDEFGLKIVVLPKGETTDINPLGKIILTLSGAPKQDVPTLRVGASSSVIKAELLSIVAKFLA